MAEYIDREALLKELYPYDVVDKKTYAINAEAIYREIKKAPAADVVEVVRCKDCVNFKRYKHKPELGECDLLEADLTDDFFCSHGERKEK